MYNIIYLQNLVTYDTLNNMERNGNIGGNNSNFEDIMHEGYEGGVSDEFTPPSLDIPDRCASCPMLGLEVKGWEDVVDQVKKTREKILKEEGGVFADIARQSPSGEMDDLALNDIAEKMQARINRITEGCLGVVALLGESDRTGKVEGVLCDSPVYDPEPGETTSNEFVSITREDSQKTEEHGESDNPSGEQDS